MAAGTTSIRKPTPTPPSAAIDAFTEELEDEGFTADPEDDDDEDDDDLEFETEECQEFGELFPEDDDGFPGETAREDSGQFAGGDFETDGGETNVEGGVALVEDDGDLDEVFELFRDDRLEDCFLEAMEASFAAQEDDDTPPVENLSFEILDEPSVGDEGVAFAVTGEILGFPFDSEITFVREGRVAAFFTETSVGEGPDLDVEDLLELLLDEASAEQS